MTRSKRLNWGGPSPLRKRLLARKPSKNNRKMDISKNEQEKNTVFLNLLRPQKSASRVGEKQISTKVSKKKLSFCENYNFRKWSSRVGESPILIKKTHKLQKSSELRRGRFLRDVSANIAILTKKYEICSIFDHPPWRPDLRDVSCESSIFEEKQGSKNGRKNHAGHA